MLLESWSVSLNTGPIRTDSHLQILNSSSPFFQSQLRHNQLRHNDLKIRLDLEFNLGMTLKKKKPHRELIQLNFDRDSQ